MSQVFAHQRVIRDAIAQSQPHGCATSLAGYSVELIPRSDAIPIILRYEWLGSVGRSTIFIGLVSPSRNIEGVSCFGWGPAGNIRGLIGSPALCLERGACVHYAPVNAASFLIASACKLVHRLNGTEIFFAYGDPMAGEYGGVYQAANWLYLGQGLNGGKGRARRTFVLPPGADPNDPACWKTTRALRRDTRLTLEEAVSHGWKISSREAKHVYAIHVGRDRKKWRKRLLLRQQQIHGQHLAYPAPHPELKRAYVVMPTQTFTVTAPLAQPGLFAPPVDR